jgi:hypothetical protein
MIEGLPLTNIGATGLLTLVVLLMLTDRLVWHKRLDALQKRIETQDKHIAELTKQNSVLLGSAVPTVNAVLSALQDAATDKGLP